METTLAKTFEFSPKDLMEVTALSHLVMPQAHEWFDELREEWDLKDATMEVLDHNDALFRDKVRVRVTVKAEPKSDGEESNGSAAVPPPAESGGPAE